MILSQKDYFYKLLFQIKKPNLFRFVLINYKKRY